jgi:type I restriction enzyme S subunit
MCGDGKMKTIQTLITDHLDIWTAADTEKKSGRGRSSGSSGNVYGIKKLRELILELAVRGKLVPQDESDEPASKLLKRIADEKAKLIAEGKIKKSKPLAEITDDEKPFNAPTNWEWVRLGVIGDWGAGATPLRSISSYYGGEIPWFKSGELSADFIDTSEETITDLALKECSLRLNKPGDVLLAMYGATIGKSAILKISATTNQAVCACTAYTGIWNEYLLVLLKAMKSNFLGQGAGGAQPNISREKIIATVTALPPTKEQHRIVAKVDELMALCDQLENQHNNAAEAHDKLVTHLLGTLTQSQNAEDFNTHWQRISEHFDTLFTTEASIDSLKQTLLQLAVMGKLVPQDPNDEPASELLKRIQAEKAKLIAEGKVKKDKPLAPITEDDKPFDLPAGWEWVRFGDISSIKSELVRPEDFQDVRQIAPDCIEKGTGRLTDVRTVKESGIRGPNSRFYNGQIVYSKIRPSLSKAVLVNFDGLCSADMYPIDVFINSQFLLKQILSECFLEQVRIAENRIKMPKLNQESLTAFILPLPPLTEQLQIVSKVNEIMTFCDQLKTQLISANQLQKKLADLLVEESI